MIAERLCARRGYEAPVAKHPGGRKATGTVVTLPDGRLQGIITVHGKRKRLPPYPYGTTEAQAKIMTSELALNIPRGTAPEWFAGARLIVGSRIGRYTVSAKAARAQDLRAEAAADCCVAANSTSLCLDT